MGDWDTTRWIVFFLPLLIALIGLGIYLLMRKTIRTRSEIDRELKNNPDINEWLVIFDWSRKVIYMPTVVVSVVCFIASVLGASESTLGTLGTVWLFVFLCNFIVEEFQVGVNEVLIMLLFVIGAGIWMAFLGFLDPFVDFIGGLSVQMNGLGYLLIALVFLTAIAISWLRGMFKYAVLTPNYINIQSGITETGTQIGREEYSTSVDTGDILERLMGFGRIIVNYTSEARRQQDSFLVWNIGRKSRKIESIRSAISIERAPRG